MTGRHHRTVPVTWGEWAADIDAAIAPLVLECWKADLQTTLSCQRHSATGKVWLAFATAHDAERFLTIVATHAPAAWARRETWYFGQYQPTAGPLTAPPLTPEGWEFHVTVDDLSRDDEGAPRAELPEFYISVSVLLPRRDVRRVLAALRAHNATP